jgi:hypothetical protein
LTSPPPEKKLSLTVPLQEVKLCSPDYQGVDPEQAVADFEMRIKNYELAYETMDHIKDKELSWVKIYNVDQRYEANRIDGERAATVLFSMCDSVLNNNYAKGIAS